ncbi:MAG: hypothetical protein GY737_22075, partial [Desulfobacteraceae bacterium]|nr:hypothetical protein [Desulfobacteraceae bacterium]
MLILARIDKYQKKFPPAETGLAVKDRSNLLRWEVVVDENTTYSIPNDPRPEHLHHLHLTHDEEVMENEKEQVLDRGKVPEPLPISVQTTSKLRTPSLQYVASITGTQEQKAAKAAQAEASLIAQRDAIDAQRQKLLLKQKQLEEEERRANTPTQRNESAMDTTEGAEMPPVTQPWAPPSRVLQVPAQPAPIAIGAPAALPKTKTGTVQPRASAAAPPTTVNPFASIPAARLRPAVPAEHEEEEEEGELREHPGPSLPQRERYAKTRDPRKQQTSVSSSAFETESGTYHRRDRDDDGESTFSESYNRDNYPRMSTELVVQWPPGGITSLEREDVAPWYDIYTRRVRHHVPTNAWEIYDELALRNRAPEYLKQDIDQLQP